MRTARAFTVDPDQRAQKRNRWGGLTLAERFWAAVDRSGECWLWAKSTNAKGYGKFGTGSGSSALAHRVAWALERGPVPPEAVVLHSRECVSRACVRPDHLRLGSQKDNVADTMALGRAQCQRGPPPWVVNPETQWLRADPASAVRSEGGRIVGRKARALMSQAVTT